MNLPVDSAEVSKAVNAYLFRKVRLLLALLSALAAGGVWLVQTAIDWKAAKIAQDEIGKIEDKINNTYALGQQHIGGFKKELENIEKASSKIGDFESKLKSLTEAAPIAAQLKATVTELKKAQESATAIDVIRKKLEAAKDISSTERNVDEIATVLAKKPEFMAGFVAPLHDAEMQMKANVAKISELQTRIASLEGELVKLSKFEGGGGIPYRVLGNTKDMQVEIHTGPIGNHDTGQIHFDPASQKAQFYRLSSAVIHDQRTPRCLARFRGWLPEKSFLEEGGAGKNIQAQLEIVEGTAVLDRKLRETPSAESRELAEFECGTVFFSTGQRKDDWVEVTCDGWVSLIYFKDSGREPVFLAAPAVE